MLLLLTILVAVARLANPPAPQEPNRQQAQPQAQRMERAVELARQQKSEEAYREFQAILEAEPGNTRAASFLAAMELQTGRVRECIRRVQGLLEADPKNSDLEELLGEAYMAARDWEKAEQAWRAVLAERPNSEQAHKQLAAVLLQRNSFEAALAEVTRSLEINPRRSDAYSLRGNILASLGRMEAAAGDWNAALVADPNDSVALAGLAVFLRERDPNRALEYAKHALDLSGGHSLGPYRVLALVYRTRGETDQARQVLERAILTFPDNDLLAADLRGLRGAPSSANAPVLQAPPSRPEAVAAATPRPESPTTKATPAPVKSAVGGARASVPPAPANRPGPATDTSLPPPPFPMGLTLGTSAQDIAPLQRLPQPPALTKAVRAKDVATVASNAKPASPAAPPLAPPQNVAGLTLGASAVDLKPLLRLPGPPRPASPAAAATASAQPARALFSPRRLVTVEELAQPDLALGRLPLSAIVPPFVYSDVISPPEPVSLGELARRLKEEKEKAKKNKKD